MPELPEVEVVRRGLDRWVTGRTIDSVEVLDVRSLRRHIPGPVDFSTRLRGATVVSASRRGKFLWLPISHGGTLSTHRRSFSSPATADYALVAHLGMSGQLLVVDPGAAAERHLRVRIGFDDGNHELRFVDQRIFGGLAIDDLVNDGRGGRIPASVAHIARDPLDPEFDETAFSRALRRRRTGLKRAMLDQSLISGIGNIYADEALWRSRQHWASATDRMTAGQVKALVNHAREVMREALAQGGTSFDSLYVNVNGESGYFSRALAVYGREDEPCDRCGRPIRREAFMNRSSYRCPRCQRTPREPRW